jgi:hypothetical protein
MIDEKSWNGFVDQFPRTGIGGNPESAITSMDAVDFNLFTKNIDRRSVSRSDG